MKISVCHVITTIDVGGAETQLLALASAQKREGMHVEVIFPKDRPAPYEVPVNIGNYSPPVENNYMTPK